MRFYFNGCSHTMGSGVQESIWTVEEKTKIWPYLVVKDINGEVTSENYVNDANRGQSNYDIWMTSTMRILHLMEVNKKPDIAIFAIANSKRFGFVPNDEEPIKWRTPDYWAVGDPHSRSVLETMSVVEIPDDYEDKPYETWVKFDRKNNWKMIPLGAKKYISDSGRRHRGKYFHKLNTNTARNFLGYHRVLSRINEHRILIEPQATDTTLNIMVSLKNFCESKNIEYYFLMMAPDLNEVIVENRVPWLNELDERTLISMSKGSKIDKLCNGNIHDHFKNMNDGKYWVSKKDLHINEEGQIEIFKVVRNFLKND